MRGERIKQDAGDDPAAGLEDHPPRRIEADFNLSETLIDPFEAGVDFVEPVCRRALADGPEKPSAGTARVVSIEDSEHTGKEFGSCSEGGEIQPGAIAQPPFDPEARYTARRGPRFELVSEEIEILRTLSEAVTKRTPSDASEEEKQALTEELFREDPELARLWERLHELVRANDESIVLALESLELEEEDAET